MESKTKKRLIQFGVFMLFFTIALNSIISVIFYHADESAVIVGIPSDPSDLISVDNADKSVINLQWTDNANNEETFNIERSADIVNSDYIAIATVQKNQLKYTDSNIVQDKRYWYRIRAYNNSGFSDYSLISTPLRNETKDYLNGAGDFEKPSSNTGMAGGWLTGTNDVLCESYIEQENGIDQTKSQYFGFKGPRLDGGNYIGLSYHPNILVADENNNFIHHGDKIVLNVAKYTTSRMNGRTNAKFQAGIYFYKSDDTEISHIYYLISTVDVAGSSYQSSELNVPDGAYRVAVSLTLTVDSDLLLGEKMGASVDGVKMSAIRGGTPQSIQVPATRNRSVNVAGHSMDPMREDLYEVATNLDMVSMHFSHYPEVLGLRYYNPNIKLIGYTSADFGDYRRWDTGTPAKFSYDAADSLSPIPFGWALDQQSKLAPGDSWFQTFPENVVPLADAKTKRAARGIKSQYEYYNDGTTPLNYVFADSYIDRYVANLDSASYREVWVEKVVAMYQRFKFDGLFLDDTGPYWIEGTKTIDGATTTVKASGITAAQVQGFLHYVVPRINAQLPNFQWLQNADQQHYAEEAAAGNCRYCGWYGRSTLKPDWDPKSEVAGKNGIPVNFLASDYSVNTFENTPKTFFNEMSYFTFDTKTFTNSFDLHRWLMAIKDIDVLNDFNKLQPDEKKKKKIYQSLYLLNNPSTNSYVNNPPTTKEEKADLSRYDDGWAHFSLVSFLMNNNKYSYIGASRSNVLGSGSSARTETTTTRDANLGYDLTTKLGRPTADRKIIYNNNNQYELNDPILDADSKKTLQYRKFQNGLIVVNGSPEKVQTFNLPNIMTDELDRLYNVANKNITLKPHTGRIFFNINSVNTNNNIPIIPSDSPTVDPTIPTKNPTSTKTTDTKRNDSSTSPSTSSHKPEDTNTINNTQSQKINSGHLNTAKSSFFVITKSKLPLIIIAIFALLLISEITYLIFKKWR